MKESSVALRYSLSLFSLHQYTSFSFVNSLKTCPFSKEDPLLLLYLHSNWWQEQTDRAARWQTHGRRSGKENTPRARILHYINSRLLCRSRPPLLRRRQARRRVGADTTHSGNNSLVANAPKHIARCLNTNQPMRVIQSIVSQRWRIEIRNLSDFFYIPVYLTSGITFGEERDGRWFVVHHVWRAEPVNRSASLSCLGETNDPRRRPWFPRMAGHEPTTARVYIYYTRPVVAHPVNVIKFCKWWCSFAVADTSVSFPFCTAASCVGNYSGIYAVVPAALYEGHACVRAVSRPQTWTAKKDGAVIWS